MRKIAGVPFCDCTAPSTQLIEGVRICDTCGERVADELLVAIYGEVKALRRTVAALEPQEGTQPPRGQP